MTQVIYDKQKVRRKLYKSIPGDSSYDWLFLPGGPGVDSASLASLVDALTCPGDYWLIDLPLNGTNDQHELTADQVCVQWPQFLEELVSQFANPVLVGHSFGGFLPLFCKGLELILKGLVLLNTTPSFESKLFEQVVAKHNLPSLDEVKQQFIDNPCLETLRALYRKEAPYFFAPSNQKQGLDEVINKMEYCIATEHWWYSGGYATFSKIKWVPQTAPTLIIESADDLITPCGLFEEVPEFNRKNIQIKQISDAGHFPWMEQPQAINEVITGWFLADSSG